MPTLELTLTPEAVGRFHDALVCLSKFNETVFIEARRDKLLFTTLNLSKSAYASFAFDSAQFFSKYDFVPPVGQAKDRDASARFSFSIYNKALLSVFKTKLFDAREKASAIERCEISIQDRPQKTECRLIVRVLKTYRLTYESVESMHALFDQDAAQNRWSVSSRVLREFTEHFGPRTEQLDIYSENGRAFFTSYTEKIVHQNGTGFLTSPTTWKLNFIDNGNPIDTAILKQPLQTSVSIDTAQFENFTVQEKLHIAISVKDFKAIIPHAETLNASVSATYSVPNRPMQLAYRASGMTCEFTLMTIGEYHGEPPAPAPMAAQRTSTSTVQPIKAVSGNERSRQDRTTMPPPERPPQRIVEDRPTTSAPRPTPPTQPPQPSIDSQSLFIPDGEEDRRWDEPNYDDEDEEMLTWDASADNDTLNGLNKSVQDASSTKRSRSDADLESASEKRIAPTQRLSQIRGIFDD
ncbi:MAG: ribosomal protein S14, S11 [Chaenotheca gracillima]|nr:MAG: ribosomal protein S14, S11 [Chaenotheca gracillima]